MRACGSHKLLIGFKLGSGRGAVWLARLNGVQEVAGSNPVAPTSQGSPAQEVAVSLALCPPPVFARATFRCHFSPDKTGRNRYGKGGEGVGRSGANQNTASPSAHAFSAEPVLEEASWPANRSR